MPEIHIINPICEDDCEGERGERGERGKRGRRGHRGHDGRDGRDGHDGDTGFTGPTGPPGAPGSTGAPGVPGLGTTGLLKFSGVIPPSGDPIGDPEVSFLADWGVGRGADALLLSPPSYPSAVSGFLRSFATNLIGFVVPPGANIIFTVLLNGMEVGGLTILYGPGEGGIKFVTTAPVPFAVGDTIDVRVVNSGASAPPVFGFIDASATVGIVWIE